MAFPHWLAGFLGRKRPSAPVVKRRPHKPWLEALEDRAVPAVAGDLQASFGTNGILLNNVATVKPTAMTLDTAGNVLSIGTITVNGQTDFYLARHLENGSFDTTFNAGTGYVATDLGGFDTPTAVTVQRDGKIVVAGYSRTTVNAQPNQLDVVRYNSDGSLDTTVGATVGFAGGDGIFTITLPGVANYPLSVAVQPDPINAQNPDRILVGGYTLPTATPTQADFLLVRLTADGQIDTTFAGGIVTTDLGGDDRAYGLALLRDGRIIQSGTAGGLAVIRYTADGSRDLSFGTAGIYRDANNLGYGVTVAPDPTAPTDATKDKILVTGQGYYDDETNVLAEQLSRDGAADAAFGTNGIARAPIVANFGYPVGAPVIPIRQNDGKLVLVSPALSSSGIDDIAFARFTLAGQVDPRFGNNGVVYASNGSTPFTVVGAANQGGGDRLIVSGTAGGTAALFRFVLHDDPIANHDNGKPVKDSNGVYQPTNINVLLNDITEPGQTLSIDTFTQGAYGTITRVTLPGNQQALRYSPGPNFDGADRAGNPIKDSFAYTVLDAFGNRATATVDILRGPNNPPAPQNDTFTVGFNSKKNVLDVLANDTDPDGDMLLIDTSATPTVQHGTLTIQNNKFVYTPNTGYFGTDTFTYTVLDGFGGSQTASVIVNVLNNRPPTAINDAATVIVNSFANINVVANDTDPDSAPLTVSSFSTPANGTVANLGNGLLKYTPNPFFIGTDTFTYRANDGTSDSPTSATVTVTVVQASARAGDLERVFGADGIAAPFVGPVPTNGRPNGNARAVALQTDGKIVAVGSAFNGSNYDIAIVRLNTDGTLDTTFGTNGVVTAGLSNNSDIGYAVALQSDGKIVVAGTYFTGTTHTALLRFNVDGTPDTAFGNNGRVLEPFGLIQSFAESIEITGTGNIVVAGFATDANGNQDVLLAQFAANGTLDPTFGDVSAGAVRKGYTLADLGGSADRAYGLAIQTDGKLLVVGESNVGSTMQAPTKSLFLLRYTSDGTALDTTFGTAGKVVVPNAQGRSLVLIPGVPASNGDAILVGGVVFSTQQALVLKLTKTGTLDTAFGSNTGKVALGSSSVVDAGFKFNLARQSDGRIVVAGVASNSATQSTDVTLYRLLPDGTLDPTFGNVGTPGVAVTPFAGDDLAAAIVVQADDKMIVAGRVNNQFSVLRVVTNNDPIALNDRAQVNAGQTFDFNVLANDSEPDGEPLTIVAVSQPSHGTAVKVGTKIRYTPDNTFAGRDTFLYTIGDGNGGTATARVVVGPPNTPPVVNPDSATTLENTPVSINVLANDSDADGDTLTVTFTQPSHGVVTDLGGGVLRYTPATNYTGPDSFTYRVNDGTVNSAYVGVSITVNKNLEAMDDTASTQPSQGVDIAVLDNDTDADGDPLRITSYTQGTQGTVTQSGSLLHYQAGANFTGDDTFTYTVTDDNGHTDTATVTVTKRNLPPTAVADMATIDHATSITIDVVDNDTDPEMNALTVTTVTQPPSGEGSVVIVNNQVKYTAPANFSGMTSFTYTISDGHGNTATGDVTITVRVPNRPPVVVNDTLGVTEDASATTGNLLTNDSDPDGDPLRIVTFGNGAHGTVTYAGNNQFTYTPVANYFGADSFVYAVTDDHGHTVYGRVDVTVASANDDPVAAPTNATTDEDQSVTIDALANVTVKPGRTKSIASFTQPAHGQVTLVNGKFVYAPTANYNGSDQFTYVVVDNTGDRSTGTVNVAVNAVDDAPVVRTVSPLSVLRNRPLAFINSARILVYDVDGQAGYTTITLSVPRGRLTFEFAQSQQLYAYRGNNTGTLILAGRPASLNLALFSLKYTPPTDFVGDVPMTVTTKDPGGSSALTDTQTVNIRVINFPPAPSQTIPSYSTPRNTVLTVPASQGVRRAFVDADPLMYFLSTKASGGTVSVSRDGGFRFVPPANYRGPIRFAVKAFDGLAYSQQVIITITIA